MGRQQEWWLEMIPETVIPTNGPFQQFSLTSLLILPLLCVFSRDSSISFIYLLFFFPPLWFFNYNIQQCPGAHRFVGSNKSLFSVKCPFPGTFLMVTMNSQGAFGTFAQQKRFRPCCGRTLQFLLVLFLYSQVNSNPGGRSQTTGEKMPQLDGHNREPSWEFVFLNKIFLLILWQSWK